MTRKNKALYIKEKILIVIYEMAMKQQKALKYEELYVRAFKKYPEDFQLRGYPKYIDTELISKKIYDLRKNGFVQVHNKFITLTEQGKTLAGNLLHLKSACTTKSSQSTALSRDIKNEIGRIKKTDAYFLFVSNKKDQIVDTDFFAYLGTTVKTERIDFGARIKTIENVVGFIKKKKEYESVIDLHKYLFDKFKELIQIKLLIGFPVRRKL